ncbi:type IV pilus assembly protein PilQ [Mucilaginibacter gracilis]|uniref:Type IV pilus assembly protein PilQ n=1 Tax=Mucilaginibacter gracilis TaxID=423350 RepID=A0A495J711_9SPHI|nr:general secretion pathway protein GspD [Mucilaginibacter gracilis]RKR84511.1 type IV pilus assembly protein PilQ [Mucilaginibacter gracilis]
MRTNQKFTFFISFFLLFTVQLFAQQPDRIQAIQDKLEQLSSTVPGLHDKVQLSFNSVSIQDFLGALSKSNGLSINVDTKLSIRITNNFTNVTALNILVFLVKNYNLDLSFTGSIITVTPYQDPNQNFRPVKQIKASYRPGDNTLSFELDNDSLYTAARKITQVSGKNIVVTPSLMGKRVSSFISNAPFDNALEKLAFANDIKMVKTSDNFYLFQSLTDGEELYVNGDKNTSVRKAYKPVNNTGGGNVGLSSRTVLGQKLISCDAVNASILDLVKAASQEMGKSYFLYSDIKGTITSHVTDISYDNFLGSLFKGTDYTFRVENGIYLLGDRKLEGLRTSRIIALQNRSIDTVQAMIPAEWKKGVEIKEFREQNTLLLSGSGPQIAELVDYIKQLDQLVPMVMIEVTLVDINKSKTNSSGIALGVADSVKTGGTLLPGVNFTFGASSINGLLDRLGGSYLNLGHVVPNFYATISALESHDNVEVHSVPKLTTLNGHTASLTVGSSRFYLVQTQNVIQSISSPTINFTQQYNKIDANMVINIKPIVSGDDQVTLGIKIDITDFIGTPPANAPAPTSTSKFESMIRAHNEDMIVLGGLERTQESEGSSGTPILSRIPLLKYIFSTRTKTVSKIVTLMFIKPTIIR